MVGSGRSRWKEQVLPCGGSLGAEVPVKVVVAEVEGYRQRFYLVSSATELTGVEMVEGFAGRFRQEDVFRDLKQRLGWEECRAWTQAPIERTSQVQWVTLSLLRLGSVPVGGRRLHGLVVASALESEEGPGPVCWTWSGCCDGMARRSGAPLVKWLGKEEGAAREPAAGSGLGCGERTGGRGGSVQRSGHFPRNRGEMRGRQPEEAET